MPNTHRVVEDPVQLSALQWFRRGLNLPLSEIMGRIFRIALGLPRRSYQIWHLRRKIKARGQRLHLIILTERLGDIIAAEPTIAALRQPNDYIVWLMRDRFSGAIRFCPLVDQSILVGSLTEALILRRIFRDCLFSVLQIDQALCNVFGIKICNPNAAGVTQSSLYDEQRTLADAFAYAVIGRRALVRPRVWPDPEFDYDSYLARRFVDSKRPLLLLHGMSDESSRCWDADKARQLAQWILTSTPFNILELGLNSLLSEGPRVQCLRDNLGLAQQFSVCSRADIFIGVDSSFSHVANALGLRCIFLLGSHRHYTDYLPWKLGDHDVVIRVPDQVAFIDVEQVKIAVQKFQFISDYL
jgi:ADP-heptose:LPS heptosyltransferase